MYFCDGSVGKGTWRHMPHTETQNSHLHLLITIAPHTYTHIYDFLAMIFVVVGGVFIYREVTVVVCLIWLNS